MIQSSSHPVIQSSSDPVIRLSSDPVIRLSSIFAWMLQQFNSFISKNGLFQPEQRVLLAVSGGVDSMVMAELFSQAGFRFGIAHCNFQLRGSESDDDERFVQSIADQYDVPFYFTKFCTTAFADLRKISIQMAARELRYAWFEEVRHQDGFDLIATAHHKDDQVETFFINLLRGTGIAGLHGIPLRNGKVIRPLLFTSREQIVSFADEKNISFREDSSNNSLHYTRNIIRHQLIPMLQSIDPDYSSQVTATIERIQGIEAVLKPIVETCRKKVIQREDSKWVVEISELRKLKPLKAWMHELFSPFGFNEPTIQQIIESFDKESGKTFYSSDYRIIKDRSQLIITVQGNETPDETHESLVIDEATMTVDFPIRLSFQSVTRKNDDPISPDKNRATLDREKLAFPLTLRRWEPGDFFRPFGMNKRKKLSDFFIDEKIPIPDKESCWLLCSAGQIVWVIGHRIDHRFRVTNHTNELLVVDYLL
ncbi:MAG: tRNA lysidine(34) synthetase TilS [Bacteroidales bacterium]|nr:tRNA lysidine(34) synthetase TilS [Bacteroidales bacterium]